MLRFELVRSEDVSGCSGVGVVAQGVEFSDGRVALRWLVSPCSTTLYDSVTDVVTIHGHEGRTVIRYIDLPIPPFL